MKYIINLKNKLGNLYIYRISLKDNKWKTYSSEKKDLSQTFRLSTAKNIIKYKKQHSPGFKCTLLIVKGINNGKK